jgi:hypothetical protein
MDHIHESKTTDSNVRICGLANVFPQVLPIEDLLHLENFDESRNSCDRDGCRFPMTHRTIVRDGLIGSEIPPALIPNAPYEKMTEKLTVNLFQPIY